MSRKFTKYPSRYVKANTDIDYKKLEDKIRVMVWDSACECIENIQIDGVSGIDFKGFYKQENSRISQILRDLDKLSEDVARYAVDTIIESAEE